MNQTHEYACNKHITLFTSDSSPGVYDEKYHIDAEFHYEFLE